MKRLAALAAVAAIAAACGASTTGSTPSPSPSPAVSTPAKAVLTFALRGINTTAKGTITVTTRTGSLSIELAMTGLQPASSHVSHIHVGSCQARGGIKFALNQVVADNNGKADVKTTLNANYPPPSGTWYVVVHAGADMQGSSAVYLLCGNLFR
jgi:hypothetical protein